MVEKGFLETSEEVMEEVADWAVETIQDVVKAINPSGIPFEHEDQPIEEQIIDYLALRGNSEAWLSFIQDRSQEIIDKLSEAGVSEDAILSVHPFNIAVKYAINYSAYMEEELRKRA